MTNSYFKVIGPEFQSLYFFDRTSRESTQAAYCLAVRDLRQGGSRSACGRPWRAISSWRPLLFPGPWDGVATIGEEPPDPPRCPSCIGRHVSLTD